MSHLDETGRRQLRGDPGHGEPVDETAALRAHLAGVQRSPSGQATLWLSDEETTMHFPLTATTVPALLTQLRDLEDAGPVEEEPIAEAPDEPAEEPRAGRLARWTGWRYSSELVRKIPPRQRAALFAAVLAILLLITLVTRGG